MHSPDSQRGIIECYPRTSFGVAVASLKVVGLATKEAIISILQSQNAADWIQDATSIAVATVFGGVAYRIMPKIADRTFGRLSKKY